MHVAKCVASKKFMHARSTSKPIQNGSAKTGAAWDEIVRLTFEACLNRSQGREHVAQQILQKTLPAAIVSWSGACGMPACDCRESLKAMFERVREQVTMASVQRRMILGDLRRRESQAAGVNAGPGKVFLSRRIPIGNISDMLDAVVGAEAESEMAPSVAPQLAIPI
jgi:hypothetical protein